MDGRVILKLKCENKCVRPHGMKQQGQRTETRAPEPEPGSQGSLSDPLKLMFSFLERDILHGSFENRKLYIPCSLPLLPRVFGTRDHENSDCGSIKLKGWEQSASFVVAAGCHLLKQSWWVEEAVSSTFGVYFGKGMVGHHNHIH